MVVRQSLTRNYCLLILTVMLIPLFAACSSGPRILPPAQLESNCPMPIEGNTGRFMCPYTSDGTVAEWTEKGKSAAVGSAVGSAVGQQLGKEAMKNVPFVGGFLGRQIGEAMGRAAAIKMCGGWDYIKETSDLSFNSLEEMSVYLYVRHSGTPDYAKVLKLTQNIYPDLKRSYYNSIYRASRQAKKN